MSDLPIENELIDGAWYFDENGEDTYRFGKWDSARQQFFTYKSLDGSTGFPFDRKKVYRRIEPVAQCGPSPAEPKGQGAVVTDRSGVRWVGLGRHLLGGSDLVWMNTQIGKPLTYRTWAQIPKPVTVLTEGVAP